MNYNDALKQLPEKPGVYLMADSLGNIIYVGKAKNLKSRVSQYFKSQKDRAPKVVEMISHIHSFDYMVTDTELDAFIEECRVIKALKPKFNKQMKNERKYCYIKIPIEEFPKLAKVNEKIDDGALYFGPFTSPHQVETVIQYLKDFYPIRKCTTPGVVKRSNGCLFLQLGTCLGVCTGRVSPDEYMVYIEKVRQLLNGNDRATVQTLTKKMDTAIQNLQFEKAAQFSAYQIGLRHVIGKQRLIQSSGKNRNVLAIEFIDSELAKLFLIKGNKIFYRKVIKIGTAGISELRQDLNQIIREKFAAEKSRMVILSQHDIDEAQIVHSYLKKHRTRILSFWIPSTRLNGEASNLNALVLKIIKRISPLNSDEGLENSCMEKCLASNTSVNV